MGGIIIHMGGWVFVFAILLQGCSFHLDPLAKDVVHFGESFKKDKYGSQQDSVVITRKCKCMVLTDDDGYCIWAELDEMLWLTFTTNLEQRSGLILLCKGF